ncbi:MAG: hypothetical protein WCP31_03370 [Chloroflexales bacterium]
MNNYSTSTGLTKPGKLQAIAILALVDGILSILAGIGWLFTICLAPIGIYSIISGIFALIYATKLLPDVPTVRQPNKTVAILQIINIVSGNVVSIVAGILSLVFYNDADVIAYFNALNGQQYDAPANYQ